MNESDLLALWIFILLRVGLVYLLICRANTVRYADLFSSNDDHEWG